MNNRTEIEKRIDILEDEIASITPTLLKLLLKDSHSLLPTSMTHLKTYSYRTMLVYIGHPS